MKFNKIITVLMLCGICSAAQHTVTAHAATDATVISNQVTFENDTVKVTTGGAVSAAAVVTSNAVGGTNGVSAISTYSLSMSESAPNAATVTEESNTVVDTTNAVSGSTAIVGGFETPSTEVVQVKKRVSKKLSSKQTKKSTKKKYTASELKLMSCIIYCEAVGEPYAGKKAVGIVVMNRKSSKSFPNTLSGVIYQKYQFGPTRNGSLKRALKKYEAGQFKSSAEKDCIKAAKATLNGDKKVTYKSKTHNMKSYHYFSTRVSGARLTIRNHQFK